MVSAMMITEDRVIECKAVLEAWQCAAGDAAQPTPAGGRGSAAGRAAAHEEAQPAAHKGAAEGPEGDRAAASTCLEVILS